MSTLDEAVSQVRRGAVALLDVLLPPSCLGCRAPVDRQGLLCSTCWGKVAFIVPPFCAVCGLPFPHDEGTDALCGACLSERPAYDRARAAAVYDEGCRSLLLGFKHGDRTEAAAAFGSWLYQAGSELCREADIVVPVPLHRGRLWQRRFNQSALLAQALGRQAGLAVVPDFLVRRRATKSQRGLSADERRRNVRGAFAVRERYRLRAEGARVLLIDDVLTTGATVEEAAKALGRAGVAGVDVLSLARVVRTRG